MPPTTEQPEKQSLTKRIKDRALAEGFDKVGVVRAEALQREEKLLNEWLDRGYHGEMQWLAREPEKRADPTRLFAPARSVVVVALNYYTPHQHSNESQT
ncbi:MAG TPA: hypothetical protein VGN86_01220, partial [Pyrinomonadaceae bacterium]|nr:hypothetical protein [Pyrinomonadaceae bacterium]